MLLPLLLIGPAAATILDQMTLPADSLEPASLSLATPAEISNETASESWFTVLIDNATLSVVLDANGSLPVLSDALSPELARQLVRAGRNFSLLCESGAPLVDGNFGGLKPLLCSPRQVEPCPLGYWCHVGSAKATTYCCPNHVQGVQPCRQAPGPGYGTGSMLRWWWDWSARTCRNFTYSGYGGNQNNFLTRGECERMCSLGAAETRLIGPALPPDYEPNTTTTPRFTNLITLAPPPVGVGAMSVDQEVSSNGRRRPLDPSRKLPNRPMIPIERNPRCYDTLMVGGSGSASSNKWSYDADIDQCRAFVYFGTQGSTNRFDSIFECNYYCGSKRPRIRETESNAASVDGFRGEGLDPCTLAAEAGEESRDGLTRPQLRWFWDTRRMGCAQFHYKGSAGNTNNFLSQQVCDDTCGPSSLPHSSACGISRVLGGGSFQIRRWAFDRRSQSCQPFFYSGCCGNANRFTSRNDCQRTCGEKIVEREEPSIIGPQPPQGYQPGTPPPYTPSTADVGSACLGGVASGGRCGLQNNFQCGLGFFCHVGADAQSSLCCPDISDDACRQPQSAGYGPSTLNRFSYNTGTGRCEAFTFHGLQGNQNNFLTYDKCQAACLDTNPCGRGSPYAPATTGTPVNCSPDRPGVCPPDYFCHVGADTLSSVCCPQEGRDGPCDQPLTSGSGSAQLQRWAFSSSERRCRPLLYNGRGGNANNFLTRDACSSRCQRQQPSSPCGIGGGFGGTQMCSTASLDSCPAGSFCHVGAGAETTMCCPTEGPDPCDGRLSTGTGASALPRYYFDRGTSTCQGFTYTGLGGNENNFLSLADCRRACPEYDNPCPAGNPPVDTATGRTSFCSAINPTCPSGFWCHIGDSRQTSVCCPFPANPCAMPRADGAGAAQLPRWFYSPITRLCEPFTYSGKAGNQNNFMGKAECEATCPVLDNPCSQGMPALTPDGNPLLCSTSNPLICPAAFYCHIGSNSATTLCCPGAGDPCRMPRSQGNGAAVINRWYFNTDTKTCLSFTYSGRGGNQNNFVSLAECRQRCPEFPNPCSTGQPHIGLNGRITQCGATSPSICPTSYWCHIGATLDSSVCCPGAGNPCDLPLSPGNGAANLVRFVYEQRSQTCRQFQYSGMNGNENNFMTLRDCESRCPVFRNPCGGGDPARSSLGQLVPCSVASLDSCPASYWCHVGSEEQSTLCCPGTEAPCTQPLAVGSGSSSLPRHYYNGLTQQCLPFLYSGSGGNRNNFLSRADCERTCPVFANPCAAGDPATNANGQYALCSSTTPNVCPAGFWCHVGQLSGNSVCCPGSENPCLLPLSVGNGVGQLSRWYFDMNLRRCSRMTYTGRGGNQNNFLSIQDCQLRCPEFQNPCSAGDPGQAPTGGILFCSSAAQTCPASFWCHVGDTRDATVCCPGAADPCLQALVPGRGSSKLRRWYYNQNTRQCLEFTYTGLGGNQNNFLAESACASACPVFRNPCPAAMGASAAVQYCTAGSRESCPAGYWCHLGLESRDSVCCPGAGDPCAMPAAQGDLGGGGPVTRWFFDAGSRTCRQFQYTGRGGNQNNFLTRTECAQKCPEFTNPCFGTEPFREVATGLVRFCSRPADCPTNHWCHVGLSAQSTVCCAGAQDPCTIAQSVGGGGGALTRWFYNTAARRCQQFTYSGLGGNQNNFQTQTECQTTCPEQSNPCSSGLPLTTTAGQITYCSATNPNICPVNYYCHLGVDQSNTLCCPSGGAANPCNLPVTMGSGSAALRRYAFNSLTRRCEALTYSGAGGNPNNFMTLQACRQACPEFMNPCKGQPYKSVGGQVLFCDTQSVCPANYFCHYGEDTITTMCCPTNNPNPCVQTVELGNGRSQLDRYYYNLAISQCVPFVYSGLGGNENNFRSAPECQARCHQQSSPCAGGATPYVEPSTGQIQRCASASGSISQCPFQYFCQVGASVFDSACCPIATPRLNPSNKCEMSNSLGIGSSRLSRWYFERHSRTCRMFTYNGLGGNANNFASRSDCERECLVSGALRKKAAPLCPQGEPLITSQGSPVGCRKPDAYMERISSAQCPNQNYVCHLLPSGSGNCCPSPRSFCLQPRSIGSCLERNRVGKKWGYNPGTDTCIQFSYSGCGGNLNNFVSLESCTDICCNKGYNRLKLADAVDIEFPLPPAQQKEVVLQMDAMEAVGGELTTIGSRLAAVERSEVGGGIVQWFSNLLPPR